MLNKFLCFMWGHKYKMHKYYVPVWTSALTVGYHIDAYYECKCCGNRIHKDSIIV